MRHVVEAEANIKMVCPWYQYGVCTSPKLPEPSEAVVSATRCLSDNEYKSCAYYVEPSAQSSQSQQKSLRKDRLKIYIPIHALPPGTTVACPEAIVIKHDTGVTIAYCKILDRPLTRFEVDLCNKYWRDCPYRRQISVSV